MTAVRPEEGRDYYVDLELPFGADDAEIKKAHRKLALKLHPDRNPGEEELANRKFQRMQSAFDFLSNSEAKDKYDRIRRPAFSTLASGVRGNPWQDIAKDFPPPPRRSDHTRTAPASYPKTTSSHTGGRRWQQFPKPPTAKGSAPEDSRNAYQAFSYMRPQPPRDEPHPRPEPDPPETSGHFQPPPPPPRPSSEFQSAPRAESARQRSQASFGNSRRPAYIPKPTTPADQSRTQSTHYDTSRHPDPSFSHNQTARRERQATTGAVYNEDSVDDRRNDAFSSERRPSEYRSTGGEKYDPFDGTSSSRSTHGRRSRAEDHPDSDAVPERSPKTKPRSSSLSDMHASHSQRKSQHAEVEVGPDPSRTYHHPFIHGGDGANLTGKVSSPADDVSPFSTPIPKSNPNLHSTQSRTPQGKSTEQGVDVSRDEPMYAQVKFSCLRPHSFQQSDPYPNVNSSVEYPAVYGVPSPSGYGDISPQLTSFERQQRDILTVLIAGAEVCLPQHAGAMTETTTSVGSWPFKASEDANERDGSSLHVTDHDRDEAATGARDRQRSLNSPVLETFSFTSGEERSTSFQFQAGGALSEKLRSRVKRAPNGAAAAKSPTTMSDDDAAAPRSEAENSDRSFDPNDWKRGFGPETFRPTTMPMPGQTHPHSADSPLRRRATGMRKTNTMRSTTMTTSSEMAVDDTSSSNESYAESQPQPQQPRPAGTVSPNAMEIDPPDLGQTGLAGMGGAPHDVNGARNIPVEPSRAEWRDGRGDCRDGQGGSRAPAKVLSGSSSSHSEGIIQGEASAGTGVKAVHGPSEDSGDLFTNFADLRHVSPMVADGTGLGSLGDLKSSLPFDSQSSGRVPIQRRPVPTRELPFPAVPIAPSLPAAFPSNAVAIKSLWEGYLARFVDYMRGWDEFNGRVIAHFAARAEERRQSGFGFLASLSDVELLEHVETVRQDRVVRKRWDDAWCEHEQRLRELVLFRQRVS